MTESLHMQKGDKTIRQFKKSPLDCNQSFKTKGGKEKELQCQLRFKGKRGKSRDNLSKEKLDRLLRICLPPIYT